MKFREQPQKMERRPKAIGVLSPEVPAEPTLYEQIGLPAELRERWDAFLEDETDDLGVCANQVQLMGDLITLFPAEADRIRQLRPLGKLVEMLTDRQGHNRGMVSAWSRVKLLAPELVPPIPNRAFDQELKLMREAGTNPIFYLDVMRTAAILFPEHVEELKRRIKIDQRDPDLDKEVGGVLFGIMKNMMMVDPSLHPTFHAYANSHRTRLEKIAKGWRTNWMQLPFHTTGSLFSAYKLVLAKEIERLPSGLLLAVEKPKLGRGAPLPERSLTQ